MKKIGPNDTCLCGSGRKYKYCCQRGTGGKKKLSKLEAEYVNALNGGRRYCQLGLSQKALECFQNAIRLSPKDARGYFYLGLLLGETGKPSEAAASFQRAIALNPDYGDAYNEFGRLFLNSSQLEQAAECFQRAIQLLPDNPFVWSNLGAAKGPVNAEEAVKCFQHALELKPDYVTTHSAMLVAINYLNNYDAEKIFKEHVRFSDKYEESYVKPDENKPLCHGASGKLRIGYVSPDFREHPVARFIEPVLLNHDAQQFEIFVYYNHPQEDGITKRLRAQVSHWHRISSMSDVQVKALIEQDKIDILVDLAGHTFRNRLPVFAQKPAPVQASWLGGPGTTGMKSIDYYLSDEVADPPGEEKYYSESIVYLSGGFSCYKPMDGAPDVAGLPAKSKGYLTFGSLNSINKINEQVIDVWAGILAANPDSRLLILRNTLNGKVAKDLLQEFVSRGIDQARLDLRGGVGKSSHYLSVYNEIDVLLDAFPWSGHTTACESLWMGVPIITLYGDRHAGRSVASVLTQLGLSEFIAKSRDEYIHIATNLANDRARLAEIRRSLRATMQDSPLCDGVGFTKHLESAYMWMSKEKSTSL